MVSEQDSPPDSRPVEAESSADTGESKTAVESPRRGPPSDSAEDFHDAKTELFGPEGDFRDVDEERAFGRYELLMEVSTGGMATLYLARIHGPESFEKVLAVKRIHAHLAKQPNFVAMFLDEAKLAARIQHPNVATIFDMGQVDNAYFIAMEYIHGNNLSEILREAARRRQLLPWELAVRIVAEAARGLHAAHELCDAEGRALEVVHRDVSPQNILVSYQGHVKVVDFGIAAAVEKTGYTRDGTLKGKAAYMSPEQANSEKVDRRSDVFCLGTVLFEALCLRRLFRRDSQAATLLAVRDAKVPRPSEYRDELPSDLERAVLKALSRNPDERFATAQELAEQLDEVLVAHRKTVSAKSLAERLTDLFHDRIKHKDIQIQRALKSDAPKVLKSIGTDWSTGSSIDLSAAESLANERYRRRKRAWITAALFLVAAVAITAGVHFSTRDQQRARHSSRSGEASNPPKAPPMPAGPADATKAGKTINLKIEYSPPLPDVVVRFRGKLHRGATFEAVIPRSEKEESLEIRAPGHETRTLVLVPTQDIQRTIRLRKVVRPRPMRPTWRPMRPPMRPMERPERLLQELPK